MKKARDVDEYIKNAAPKYQGKLLKLRKIIKSTVPQAQEKISYSMPYYGYKGRLCYFNLSSKHIGFYIPPPVIEKHKKELKNFSTAKSTVRLPLDQNLPSSLIKKLLKARKKLNEEK